VDDSPFSIRSYRIYWTISAFQLLPAWTFQCCDWFSSTNSHLGLWYFHHCQSLLLLISFIHFSDCFSRLSPLALFVWRNCDLAIWFFLMISKIWCFGLCLKHHQLAAGMNPGFWIDSLASLVKNIEINLADHSLWISCECQLLYL